MDRRDHYAMHSDYPKGTTFNKRTMMLIVPLYEEDEEGGYVESKHEIPCSFEVCQTCHGKGTHVNPSIDAHGITESERAEWDCEEEERYFGGFYDQTCNECKGERVVPMPNEDLCNEEQKKSLDLLLKWQEDERDYQRTCESERRMGC